MSSEDLEGSELIDKGSCPACGSSDACASYTDGHTHCFSCGKHTRGDGAPETTQRKPMSAQGLLPAGDVVPLIKRGITEETCAKWGYTVGELRGQKVQIASYRNGDNIVVAQKVRTPAKEFLVYGNMKEALPLYGQWLWRDGGRKVIVTEGEIDALTVSQLQGNKWPVVSIPNGAEAGPKAVAKALEWLMKYDEVIFMFDQDTARTYPPGSPKAGETFYPGQDAAKECAALFPSGKAKIATLSMKDPSELMQAGRGEEVIKAMWDAKSYTPDGIVNGADLWSLVEHEDKVASMPWPVSMTSLQAMTRGFRGGEVVTFTAGSGIGKSAVVREVAKASLDAGQTVGMLMLEESTKRTALGLMGIALNYPLHLDRDGISEVRIKEAFDATLGTGRLFLYDHFGSTESENLFSRLRYMAKGCGCKVLILDHLSIVVSGTDEDSDERKLIDKIMTRLATLAAELDVCIIIVSHLKRPSGDKGHEEGASTSLSQLRGSHAIAQLSHTVIGLERNQQGDNPLVTTLRVLKCRWTGETGIAGYLLYDRITGRLSETTAPEASSNRSTPGAPEDTF